MQIGLDNTNMIHSVCNHCKKELKCGGNLFNNYLLLVTFDTDDSYSIQFEMKKTLFTQH